MPEVVMCSLFTQVAANMVHRWRRTHVPPLVCYDDLFKLHLLMHQNTSRYQKIPHAKPRRRAVKPKRALAQKVAHTGAAEACLATLSEPHASKFTLDERKNARY